MQIDTEKNQVINWYIRTKVIAHTSTYSNDLLHMCAIFFAQTSEKPDLFRHA